MFTQYPQQNNVNLAERFSLFEKILMRMGFYGFIIIGAYGIYSESVPWGLLYTVFVIFGLSVLLSYCLCAHCPYPYKYSDCLFMPLALINKYKFRSRPMSTLDKIGFIVMMVGVVVIPQYWLLKNSTILIIFWIFYLPTFAGFLFYECRRCRHFDCPFNLARKESGEKHKSNSN